MPTVQKRRALNELTQKVNFDIYLNDNDIRPQAAFPPTRFTTRNKRLQSLQRLWFGDFSDVIEVPDDFISINYCQSYSTRLANLLLMVQPEPLDTVDSDILYDAVVDLTRYGGCILARADDALMALDPMTWYPVDTGANAFVTHYVSSNADNDIPDRVMIRVFYENGVVEDTHYSWSGDSSMQSGRIGTVIERNIVSRSAQVIVLPKAPRQGIWGLAKYLELASPTAEIANRMSRNSRVLDLNGRPVPVFKQGDTDADREFGITDDDTTDETLDKIERGQVDILNREIVRLPDGVMDFKFESPNVSGVSVSLDVIERSQHMISQLTGMPSLTGEYVPPSGVALKRLLLNFYAESSAMQNSIVEALAELGITIEWRHPFDVLEEEAVENLTSIGANANSAAASGILGPVGQDV